MMVSSERASLVRRFLVDAYSEGNLDLLDAIVAEDYVDRNAPPGTAPGRDGVRNLMAYFRGAFPDFHFSIEETIEEGDKIAVRYTVSGTHLGELFGIPPTGKTVSVGGISIYRVAGDRLQEAWVQYDALGLMQQLGAVPADG